MHHNEGEEERKYSFPCTKQSVYQRIILLQQSGFDWVDGLLFEVQINENQYKIYFAEVPGIEAAVKKEEVVQEEEIEEDEEEEEEDEDEEDEDESEVLTTIILLYHVCCNDSRRSIELL